MRGYVGKYQTKQGERWQYTFDIGRDATGKRLQRKKRGFATETEAWAALRKEMVERDQGTHIDPATCTLAEYLDEWLIATEAARSPATHVSYRSIIRARIAPALGDIKLAKLTPLHVRRFYADLKQRYAAKTIIITHQTLRQALAQAVAWRMIPTNPTDGAVLPPDRRRREVVVWTADEARRFLSHTAREPDGPLYRLLLDSGMRIGEAIALAWRDVDLDRGVITIRRTLTRDRDGRFALGETAKTSAGRRVVAIARETVAALRAQRARQAERRLRTGEFWQDHNLVFDRGDGRWLMPQSLHDRFPSAVEAAGVPILTPHGLRHTCATLLLLAGVPLKVVSARLGHAGIAITADLYGHVTEEADRAAADRIGALLREPTA